MKLIPEAAQNITFNRQLVEYLIGNPFPDGTFVYRKWWEDEEGTNVVMDNRGWTLRHLINPNQHISQATWGQIIYGIADRLVHTHGEGIVHRDLKPSNGTSFCS